MGAAVYLAAVIYSRFAPAIPAGSFDISAALPVFLAAYIVIGGDVVKKAVKNIGHGQIFDENFLMTVATAGAFLVGEYAEAVAPAGPSPLLRCIPELREPISVVGQGHEVDMAVGIVEGVALHLVVLPGVEDAEVRDAVLVLDEAVVAGAVHLLGVVALEHRTAELGPVGGVQQVRAFLRPEHPHAVELPGGVGGEGEEDLPVPLQAGPSLTQKSPRSQP